MRKCHVVIRVTLPIYPTGEFSRHNPKLAKETEARALSKVTTLYKVHPTGAFS